MADFMTLMPLSKLVGMAANHGGYELKDYAGGYKNSLAAVARLEFFG